MSLLQAHGLQGGSSTQPSNLLLMPLPRSPFPALLLLILAAGCSRATSTASSPANASAVAAPMPAGVTEQLIANGDRLFNSGACVRCHGPRGVGGQNGPSLLNGPWLHASGNISDIARVITTGVPKEQVKVPTRRFAMNPRGGPMALNDEQIRALAAYVWSISRRKT
jgi:mono/diheme cytochrome c family protein